MTSIFSARPFSGFFSSWADRPASLPKQESQRAGASPTGSFACVRIVGRGLHRDASGRAATLDRRLHEARDCVRRTADTELLEEKAEGLVVGGGELRLHILRQIPQIALEGPERLLPTLVVELLVGVALLSFLLRILIEPFVDPPAKLGRHLLEENVLKVRREVNFRGFDAREVVERALGKGRRAVLHRARHSEVIASNLRERLERVEIELHIRDAAVWKNDAAVRRPRLHRDL